MVNGGFSKVLVRLFMGACSIVFSLAAPLSFAAPLVHYPQATEVIQSNVTTDDYLLTLGALKKVNGQWRSDREERIGGQLTRNTFELDAGHDVKEVFEYYRRQLIQMGAREIYLCRARGCGSSNSWANNRFGIKLLYGLDQHQHYSVFSIETTGGNEYIALYGVLRGNKRSYVHVDSIKSRVNLELFSSSEVIENQLQAYGAFALSDFKTEGVADAQLNALVRVLKANPRWQLAVVGINREPNTLEKQMALSEEMAQAIKSQFMAQGVSESRITAAGIGSLVPESMSVAGARSVLFSLVEL